MDKTLMEVYIIAASAIILAVILLYLTTSVVVTVVKNINHDRKVLRGEIKDE